MPYRNILAVALLTASLPAAALASHGKAGLWKVTVTLGSPGAGTLTASQKQSLKQKGVDVVGRRSMVVEHCMTAAEAASDELEASNAMKDCAVEQRTHHGATFSGLLVCHGAIKGEGRLTLTYRRPEHYVGHMYFAGIAQGQPIRMRYGYDGHWVSPNCGKVQH